jgi:hypothetical protein
VQDYYRRVAGEHENWVDYRAAMRRERRVLLQITLDRAGPDRAGYEPRVQQRLQDWPPCARSAPTSR